jgi:hypothetical protein
MQTDKPKAATPFHAASDMAYFEDPTPPRKKKEDPLVRILAAEGFESESERERETGSWSPPPVEEIVKSSQPPPNVTSKKGKKSEKYSGNVRDPGEAHDHRINIPNSSSTNHENFHESAPEKKRWTKLAAEGIQSPTQQPVPAPTKRGKRKAEDMQPSEQPVDGRSQSKRKSQRSQKTQPPRSQHPLRSNVHSTELHRRNEADDDLEIDQTVQLQEVIEIHEVEVIAEFRREESHGNAMGLIPPSHSRLPDPGSDLNREIPQEGSAGGAIEVSSAHGGTDERLFTQAKHGVPDTAAAPDNLPAEQLEDDFELPHEQVVPKQRGRGSTFSRQECDRRVSVLSSDERLSNTSGQTSSSAGLQRANISSSVSNALGKGISYKTAQSPASEQKHASETRAPPQDSRLGYSANCSLDSSLPSRSEDDSITDLRVSFGVAQGTRHSAPEAVWKQAIADDAPPVVLRSIVSVRFLHQHSPKVSVANWDSLRYCIVPSDQRRMPLTTLQRSIAIMP